MSLFVVECIYSFSIILSRINGTSFIKGERWMHVIASAQGVWLNMLSMIVKLWYVLRRLLSSHLEIDPDLDIIKKCGKAMFLVIRSLGDIMIRSCFPNEQGTGLFIVITVVLLEAKSKIKNQKSNFHFVFVFVVVSHLMPL